MNYITLYTYEEGKLEPKRTNVPRGKKLKDLPGDVDSCHIFHCGRDCSGDHEIAKLDPDLTVDDADFNERDSILFHKCKTIEVTVKFNGGRESRRFPVFKPAKDVLRFALKKFEIDENEDMTLAPKEGVREAINLEIPIGCYTSGETCEVTLYLVTEEFIQGFTHPGADMLSKHIEEAFFQLGIDKGKWGIVGSKADIESNWPKLVVWIKPAKKEDGPDKYYLRFDLSGYPKEAPTATLWDLENDKKLSFDRWPKGRKRWVNSVFKQSWKNGDCLYIPCDRNACDESHRQNWETQYPHLMWDGDKDTIYKYVSYIYKVLNSKDYKNA